MNTYFTQILKKSSLVVILAVAVFFGHSSKALAQMGFDAGPPELILDAPPPDTSIPSVIDDADFEDIVTGNSSPNPDSPGPIDDEFVLNPGDDMEVHLDGSVTIHRNPNPPQEDNENNMDENSIPEEGVDQAQNDNGVTSYPPGTPNDQIDWPDGHLLYVHPDGSISIFPEDQDTPPDPVWENNQSADNNQDAENLSDIADMNDAEIADEIGDLARQWEELGEWFSPEAQQRLDQLVRTQHARIIEQILRAQQNMLNQQQSSGQSMALPSNVDTYAVSVAEPYVPSEEIQIQNNDSANADVQAANAWDLAQEANPENTFYTANSQASSSFQGQSAFDTFGAPQIQVQPQQTQQMNPSEENNMSNTATQSTEMAPAVNTEPMNTAHIEQMEVPSSRISNLTARSAGLFLTIPSRTN